MKAHPELKFRTELALEHALGCFHARRDGVTQLQVTAFRPGWSMTTSAIARALQKVILCSFKCQRIGVPPINVFDIVFPSNCGSDQYFTRS